MRKFVFLLSLCVVSCGGVGGGSDLPSNKNNEIVEEHPVTDPFVGEWESGCISSQVFGEGNSLFITWGIESLKISEDTLSRKIAVYDDSACSVLIQSLYDFSSKIESKSEFVSDDGYASVKFNLLTNGTEDSVSLSFVDGVLYRVNFDILHFESTGEIKNNVIFDVKYDRVQ